MVPIKFCGKRVSDDGMKLVRELSEEFWGISRTELASTVCELLDWKRPGGGLKIVECLSFLEDLAERTLIVLPKPRRGKPKGAKTRAKRTAAGEQGAPLEGSFRDIGPASLARVENTEGRELWKELVDRYHYLGFKVPFGACVPYLVLVKRPEPRVVGCLQFSSPAWKVEARDAWIGWDAATREKYLQRVVQNSRFLILPWCKVKGLASHVLGLAARQVGADWEAFFKVKPLLLETFVDVSRFKGTCYRAANWIHLGETQGRGRMDRHHAHAETLKSVWVYPLSRNYRTGLGAIVNP